MNERQIIECLHRGVGPADVDGLIHGIGDDCAVINKDGQSSMLVTMDTLVENIHFDLRWHPAEKLGRKSVAVNVSDIAGMGGKPKYVFLSLGMPLGFDPAWLDFFSQGIADACQEFGCFLAGGDTIRSPQGVVITLTVIGEVAADKVVYRKGARSGDMVWVSGSLGMAAAGLELCKRDCENVDQHYKSLVAAHLDPTPRVYLGQLLAENKAVHAMMDLSDGLATDLSHLCAESRVGAKITHDMLPIDPAIDMVSQRLHIDPLDLVIRGGEDYELLFTAAPEKEDVIKELGRKSGIMVTAIGTVVEQPGVRLITSPTSGGDQEEIDISYEGFDHFAHQ